MRSGIVSNKQIIGLEDGYGSRSYSAKLISAKGEVFYVIFTIYISILYSFLLRIKNLRMSSKYQVIYTCSQINSEEENVIERVQTNKSVIKSTMRISLWI